jgi:hypothetical protein
MALADAWRRERQARAAADAATKDAREAARVVDELLAELRTAGVPVACAARRVAAELRLPLDGTARRRIAATFRKRLERRRERGP